MLDPVVVIDFNHDDSDDNIEVGAASESVMVANLTVSQGIESLCPSICSILHFILQKLLTRGDEFLAIMYVWKVVIGPLSATCCIFERSGDSLSSIIISFCIFLPVLLLGDSLGLPAGVISDTSVVFAFLFLAAATAAGTLIVATFLLALRL